MKMPYLKEGEEGEKDGMRDRALPSTTLSSANLEMILREIDLHNLLIRFYWTRIVDSWLLKDQNC